MGWLAKMMTGYHHVQAVGIEEEGIGVLDVFLAAGSESQDDTFNILALESLDGFDERPLFHGHHIVRRFPKQANLLAEWRNDSDVVGAIALVQQSLDCK